MVKTFTKIRKWAEENNLEVIDSDYFEKIVIYYNDKPLFEIENRNSTIYRSGRTGTLKGNSKGLYLSRNGFHGFHMESQNEAILEMNEVISGLIN